jgi:hypothetical protein
MLQVLGEERELLIAEVSLPELAQMRSEFLLDLVTHGSEYLGDIDVVPDDRFGHGDDGLVARVCAKHFPSHARGEGRLVVDGHGKKIVGVPEPRA